jgi:hypothetical protein
MAKKLLLLHVGPDPVDVSSMTEALALGRVTVPDVGADTLLHAGIEIRRAHKAAGLRRKQVEGAWAKTCRRAYKTRKNCFVSVPGFFDATPEQAALAMDSLDGLKVVLVVTSGFDVEAPEAWLSLVKEGRAHVLPSRLSDEQLAAQVARIALIEEQARLARRLLTTSRRRTRVDRRLAA